MFSAAWLIWINVAADQSGNLPHVNQSERSMSTGEMLYLVMCIGAFTVFAIVLAMQSWQQSRKGPDMLESESADASHHGHAVHA